MFSPSSMLPGFATFSIGAERTLQEYGSPSSSASLSSSLSNTSCVLAFLQRYVQVSFNGGRLKRVTNRGQRKYCTYISNKPLKGAHHIINDLNRVALQHFLNNCICVYHPPRPSLFRLPLGWCDECGTEGMALLPRLCQATRVL